MPPEKRHSCVSSRRAEELAAIATTLRVMNELVAFEQAVLAQAPPGALLVGASVSPDGKYGAALTLQPGANYQMDDVLVRRGDRWEPHSGGSGGGTSWTWLGEEEDLGVLRYGGEAPEGASGVLVNFQGKQQRVIVRHGHFLFVAWNVTFDSQPTLVGFD